MNINNLLKEIELYWNMTSDPQLKGEHPECNRLYDLLLIEFRKLKHEELINILSNMSKNTLEQIYTPLITMIEEDNNAMLKAYIN